MKFLFFVLISFTLKADMTITGSTSFKGNVLLQSIEPIQVDMFQDFNNQPTDGTFITDSLLNSGQKGLGSWQNSRFGSNYIFFHAVTNIAYNFKTPIIVGTNKITSTGIKWLRTDYPDHYDAALTEYAYWVHPQSSATTNRVFTVRLFIRFGMYNITDTLNNLDMVSTYGNPFGAFQLQTQFGTRRYISHASLNDGSSNNGPPVYLPDQGEQIYYFVMRRDGINGTWTIRCYDPISFIEVGSTTTVMGTNFNAYIIYFGANYLTLGNITGFAEFGGISVTWTNDNLDP